MSVLEKFFVRDGLYAADWTDRDRLPAEPRIINPYERAENAAEHRNDSIPRPIDSSQASEYRFDVCWFPRALGFPGSLAAYVETPVPAPDEKEDDK